MEDKEIEKKHEREKQRTQRTGGKKALDEREREKVTGERDKKGVQG